MRMLGLVALTLLAGSTVQAQTGKHGTKQAAKRAELVGRWISAADSLDTGDSVKIRLGLEADSTVTLTILTLSPAADSVMPGASTRDGVAKFTGVWNLTGDTLTINLQKALARTPQGWQDLPTRAGGTTERWRVQIEGTHIAMTSL